MPLTLEAGDFVLLPATPGFTMSGFEPVQLQPLDPNVTRRSSVKSAMARAAAGPTCDCSAAGSPSTRRTNMHPRTARSLSVRVLDPKGYALRAGAEVRIDAAGTRRLLGTRLVDTGSGYNAQNYMAVHFGLPAAGG